MKKLMIAAFAVAFAAVAQAAAVTWNSGTFANGFVGPDSATLASSTAYTMVVSFYTDAEAKNLVADVTGVEVTTAKPNGSYNTTTSNSFAADTTYYIKAVITSNDGAWIRESEVAAFSTPGQGNSNLNLTTGSGFDTTTAKWGAWTENVPEPTSGLLLLLGMGALALRRKQA